MGVEICIYSVRIHMHSFIHSYLSLCIMQAMQYRGTLFFEVLWWWISIIPKHLFMVNFRTFLIPFLCSVLLIAFEVGSACQKLERQTFFLQSTVKQWVNFRGDNVSLFSFLISAANIHNYVLMVAGYWHSKRLLGTG